MARKQRVRRHARLKPAGSARSVRFFSGNLPADSFLDDVIAGLSLPQKALPPKYFYDAEGSRLFARICRLREYYPTRAELSLTRRHLAEIARFAGAGCELIEYGSGEGIKTRLLIEHLRPARYVAVDISEAALRGAAARLASEFGWLPIDCVVGDFSRPLNLPPSRGARSARRVAYFPGSTIGNLSASETEAFLRMTRAQVGPRGAMLVGVDLKKDANVLHAAYNDSRAVTAAFNLNLLARINRELDGDFDLRRFRHYAFYNASQGRVEMHLVSLAAQSVRVGRGRFDFEPGETIHTENSCKYSIDEFRVLAAQAGFRAARVWCDRRGQFSLHGLSAA
ncbi:MAG TPA: L-histidine N(alpha)-methyltransferase [Burkholderiales bacterium]|nr:L-histidine N(alpha)-methyltransferase [Burkholderiales bacterium]